MKKFAIIATIIMFALFILGICAMSDACAEAPVKEIIVFEDVQVIAITPMQAGVITITIDIDNEEFVFYWDETFYFNQSVTVKFYTFGTTDHTLWEIIDVWQE